MIYFNRGLIVSVALLLQSCANLDSIYREYKTNSSNGATSTLIDVKQRAIISNQRAGETITCAEPSPDALSVLATGLSGSLNTGNSKALDLALSQTESATFIGNRTVTIQLLRDNLYRACEAYMNGALTQAEYNEVQRRYQVMTMGLLAIEQLTETIKPAPIVINAGNASASIPNETKVSELRNKVAETDGKIQTSKDEISDTEKKLTAAENAENKDTDAGKSAITDLKDKLKTQKEELTTKESTKNLLLEEYNKEKGEGVVKVAVSAEKPSVKLDGADKPAAGQDGGKTNPTEGKTVQAVVYDIVQLIVNDGFKLEKCLVNKDRCELEKVVDKCDGNTKCLVVNGLDKNAAKSLSKKTSECYADVATGVKNKTDCEPVDVDTKTLQAVEKVIESSSNPNDLFANLRFDVFSDRKNDDSQITSIINGLKAKNPQNVRYKYIDSDRCMAYPKISSGQNHIIKYDNDISAEVNALSAVSEIVAQALGILKNKVQSRDVTDPTPYYMSIFVCGEANPNTRISKTDTRSGSKVGLLPMTLPPPPPKTDKKPK